MFGVEGITIHILSQTKSAKIEAQLREKYPIGAPGDFMDWIHRMAKEYTQDPEKLKRMALERFGSYTKMGEMMALPQWSRDSFEYHLKESLPQCKFCKKHGHEVGQCMILKDITCKLCGHKGHTEIRCKHYHTFISQPKIKRMTKKIRGTIALRKYLRKPDIQKEMKLFCDRLSICELCKMKGHTVVSCTSKEHKEAFFADDRVKELLKEYTS